MADDRKARYERRQRTTERRRRDSRQARRSNKRRDILRAGGIASIAAVIIGVVILFGSLQKVLPPTTFGPNHSELLPPQQINRVFIPVLIQEHVMERNLTHPPGQMLIEYNCVDYECDANFVSDLEDIVRSYPPTVYMAPFPGMDAKIAMAAPGRLEILDGLDEGRIRSFIENNLNR